MHTKEIEAKKKGLILTKQQREIIIGCILGDGHLETQNRGRTYRLKIEHSEKQRAYVDWLYEQFREWVLTPPQEKVKVVRGHIHRNYWFSTMSHGALRYYAQQFYRLGIKKVPDRILSILAPRVFAVWFMDDGSVKSRATNGRIINTHGFTRHDVRRLCTALNKKFNLHTRERYQRDGWQIFIPAEDATNLVALLQPYMIPFFAYKLPQVKGNERMPKR